MKSAFVSIAALLVLVTAGLALSGCSTRDPRFNQYASPNTGDEPGPWQKVAITNKIEAGWLQSPSDRFTLGPGDKLDVELIGETNTLTSTVVGPDGKLYFNLLPGIDVWGLTLSEAKARMQDELKKYVRDRPQVSLMLRAVESKRIWVLGRVQAPGVYPLTGPMTVLEAISLAGGTLSLSSFQNQDVATISDELADFRRSFLIRNGRVMPVDFEALIARGDLSQNIYLQPDDFIYLPSSTARVVYVLGAVAQPRLVPYRPDLTVASAIASAYGTIDGAYMQHVAVVRGSLREPDMTIVNYKQVIRGEAKDIALEPHDIVYVPYSPYRYIYRYLDVIINTFATSAAINAGSRAIGPDAGGGTTGVFIPVGSGVQVIPPPNTPPIR